MLQAQSIRTQIDGLTAQGNGLLAEASESGNQSVYLKAIEAFALCYKYALLLNSKDGTEQVCAFNLGAAHIAGGDTSRGITLLKTILDHGGWPENHEKSNEDTYRGDVYFNLAIGYEKVSELENAMKCYMNALLQYNHEEDARKVAETYLKLANLSNSKKDYAEARRNFDLAGKTYIRLRDDGNAITAQTCQVNAGILDKTFAREECIRILNNCCNLCGTLDNKGFQGKILCEIGLLYYKVGCIERALLCFEKSVNLCELAHVRRKAVSLQNAGAILNVLGYYEEAIPRHAEAARLHGCLTNRNAQGQSFCNLAFAYSQLGGFEEAWESYLHALKAFEDTGDRKGQWQCHEGLGAIAYNGGRIKNAIEHFNKALACQTEAISDGSRQRVLDKLSNALRFEHQEGENDAQPLAIESGTRLTTRKSDERTKESSSDDDVVDTKMSKSKPRRSVKGRRMKSLDRGRRPYPNESDRPIKHIARGMSNLTNFTNPYAESQTYVQESGSESDVPDFLSDVQVPARPESSMSGSLYAEKKNKALFHNQPSRRKKIRGLVQASTMPINALTVAADGDGPGPSTQELNKELPDNSPRSHLSNSHEKLVDYYKGQLPKINEDKSEEDEESYTSVTDTFSSSSDDEPDGGRNRSLRGNANKTDDQANASSLAAPGSGFDTEHLYASINTGKRDAPTVSKQVKLQPPVVTDEEFKITVDDHDSGEDIPPLLSAHSPRRGGETERISIKSEEDDEREIPVQHSSAPPPAPPIHSIPPGKKKKKSKEKSSQSRTCMIM